MIGELFNSQQAAQFLAINEETLLKMAADKKVPAQQIEGGWQFNKATLQQWLGLQSCRRP